jgi:hypothetical protein
MELIEYWQYFSKIDEVIHWFNFLNLNFLINNETNHLHKTNSNTTKTN